MASVSPRRPRWSRRRSSARRTRTPRFSWRPERLLRGAPREYGRAVPRSTILVALCAALLAPAVAQAATKTVDMGAPKASQKALSRYGADVNAFFPATITIHRGDSVKFVPTGFHSIELPAKGSSPLAFTASTGQTIAGAHDAAGVPYWFN